LSLATPGNGTYRLDPRSCRSAATLIRGEKIPSAAFPMESKLLDETDGEWGSLIRRSEPRPRSDFAKSLLSSKLLVNHSHHQQVPEFT